MDIKKTKRPGSEVALSGVVPATDIEREWNAALKAIVAHMTLPGFRKGHAPVERVIKEVGEAYVWREAAERVLNSALKEILKEQEVTPIMPLALSMKPAEKGADVQFEIVATVAPSVEVNDYKGVSEKALKKLPAEDEAKGEAEAKESFMKQVALMGGDEDPKKIGFENKEALEFFLTEQAKKAVADKAVQKKRGAVAEALLVAFKADIPRLLVTEEARAMMETMKRDIAAGGTPWSKYLEGARKSEEQILADLAPHAEKRVALDLIFAAIIKKEEIKLEGDEAKKKEDEVAHALAHQGVPHDRAHAYARETLLRKKVWEILGVRA